MEKIKKSPICSKALLSLTILPLRWEQRKLNFNHDVYNDVCQIKKTVHFVKKKIIKKANKMLILYTTIHK